MIKRIISTSVVLVLLAGLSHSVFAQSSDSTFKPSGKISMQFFADYYYQIGASDTIAKRGSQYYSATPHFYQAFDLRRVYLGYDYNFTKDIAAAFLIAHENGALATTNLVTAVKTTTDSTKHVTTVTTTTSAIPTNSSGDIVLDGNRGLYIKGANVRFKGWVPNASVVVGQQGTYAFSLAESMWGYRSIEKTVMDARGLAQSNDLGIALAGTFDADANFGYSAMISNGNGAKAENDKYKKFAGELNAKLLDKKIVVDVYYDMMAISQTVDRNTISVFAGLSLDPITVGVQYAMQNQDTSSAGSLKPNAISVFARGTIVAKQLSAFARYDIWNPNSNNTTTVYKENFLTAGLDWSPDAAANVHIMPNIWMNTYAEQGSLAKIDADFVGRLTFFYKF